MSSSTAAADKPPKACKAIVHKTARDDVENQKKKPRKKTADGVLRSSNDVIKSEPSHTVKRKSEQLTNHSAELDEDSGCPLPKKPSPEHIVSLHSMLSIIVDLSSLLDTVH